LLVEIEHGQARRLRGSPLHPVTRGFLCAKVTRYLERQYSPERLLHPQRRVGTKGAGRFERISWEAAIDEIAGRLDRISAEHGSESILPYSYAGTMGLLNNAGMDRRFFHRLGASRLERTICSSAGKAGLIASTGFRYGTEPEQFRHSRLILAWGANIMGTSVHLWPFIQEAKRNGARFYTIDPVRNHTAELADRHYAIHPGGDAALALGLMHVIIGEELHDQDYVARYTLGFAELAECVKEYPPERVAALTGIAAEDIIALAREYATTRPASIRLNYGVQRSERGAMAVRAISLLPALTGSWKEVGGGSLLSTTDAFQFDTDTLERPDLQLASPLGREARSVNMIELGRALTSLDAPPIKALVVYNSNPAAVAPMQNAVLSGLAREDLFTVVLEQFQTDTADYADILLPATTFLEHTDLYLAYGHYHVQLARPVVAACGEAKSNVQVFRLLARRMGFAEACFEDSEDEMIRQLLGSGHRFLDGITLERLEREHSVRLNVASGDAPFSPFADGNFGTPSGKCEFHAETLAYTPPVESRLGDQDLRRRYPLELISPKADQGLNSTFGNRPEVDAATAVLHLNTADAAARAIRDGDPVRVFNDRGECRLVASVDGAVAPGVVAARAVSWNKLAACRRNVNALTSDRRTDMGAGPVFYSCLVEVQTCSS
jgi:anaerobic selenocysteine-containing dehydrogenase